MCCGTSRLRVPAEKLFLFQTPLIITVSVISIVSTDQFKLLAIIYCHAYISDAFVKFSQSKTQKNIASLDQAGGLNSDELAETIARKWGRDALEVEQRNKNISLFCPDSSIIVILLKRNI